MSATVPRQNHAETTGPPSGPAVIDGRTECAVPTHERDDVVVLAPLGQLDPRGIERVRHAALAVADRAVVIDLTDCVLTNPNALVDLVEVDDDPVEVCFVSRRPTCRLLLARTGITSRFAVFHQLEDALQARAFADAGYGPGWRAGR